MNDIPAGKYVAKVVDYFVDKTKDETPRVNISFNVTVSDKDVRQCEWSGSFKSEKSRANVLKTLEVCGLRSPDHLALLTKGKAAGVLDLKREVQVTVTHEQKTSQNGKPYTWVSIAWVNPLGGQKQMADFDEFAAFVTGTGLAGEFMALAQKNGVKIDNRTYEEEQADSGYSDIPF